MICRKFHHPYTQISFLPRIYPTFLQYSICITHCSVFVRIKNSVKRIYSVYVRREQIRALKPLYVTYILSVQCIERLKYFDIKQSICNSPRMQFYSMYKTNLFHDIFTFKYILRIFKNLKTTCVDLKTCLKLYS